MQWEDPVKDGMLQKGSMSDLNGGGLVSKGNQDSKDWVVLVRRKRINLDKNENYDGIFH